MNVLVFKTNISNYNDANQANLKLMNVFSPSDVHIDLEDCDNVLRIESNSLTNIEVVSEIKRLGFECAPL